MSESLPPPQMNPPLPARTRSTALGFIVDSIMMGWRWLSRMRTALYMLAALAVLNVIGTFVPQEPNVPSTVARWRAGTAGPGEGVSRVIDAIGAYDIYGSVLFIALLFAIFLSLTACLIPRIRAYLRLARTSVPPLVDRPSDANTTATFITSLPADDVLHTAESVLFSGWRTRRNDGNKRPQVAAEKGLISREGGSLMFHVSFYVLLAAIVFGQLTTFEGQRGVVEGEAGFTDAAVSYWHYSPGRWFHEDQHNGWRFALNQFDVDWVRNPNAPGAGQPTVFRSHVTITPPGAEPYDAVIDSNRPLMVDGKRITQLDWGYALKVRVEVDGEVVHDAFIQPMLGDAGVYRGAVKVPSVNPDLGLDVFFYPYAPEDSAGRPIPTGAPWADAPMLLFRQWRGDLQLGATQQTVNDLDTTLLEPEGGAYLRVGQQIQVGDALITFVELRRWVGYQVSSRPAIPALLAGALLLVFGLTVALYAYRRRMWVLTEPADVPGQTLVTLTGRAFHRPDAFADEFEDMQQRFAEACAAKSVTTVDAQGVRGLSDL
jgi:cytochrome c biogenesis protein